MSGCLSGERGKVLPGGWGEAGGVGNVRNMAGKGSFVRQVKMFQYQRSLGSKRRDIQVEN